MLRTALSLYLVAITVAGPALCCCSSQRLFAFLRRPTEPTSAAPAQPKSCCHHGSDERNSAPAGAPGCPKPSDGPKCPCRQDPSPTLASASLAGDGGWRLAQGELTFDLGAVTSESLVKTSAELATATFQNNAVYAFRTSADMLRALHILRC